jgi:uncharacterized membrane protein
VNHVGAEAANCQAADERLAMQGGQDFSRAVRRAEAALPGTSRAEVERIAALDLCIRRTMDEPC